MNELETRLAEALDRQANDVLVSGDAWQRNEQRLATGGTQQRARRLQVAGVAAAVAGVVALGAVVLPRVGDGSTSVGGSADGLVGRKVVVERSATKDTSTRHVAYLSRDDGKGLSLCDSVEVTAERGSGNDSSGSSSGSGGCSAPRPAQAFRFFSGGESDTLHSLVGATVPSVVTVRAWSTDGSARAVSLHPLGTRGLQAFGITTTGPAPKVQRLVGYDAQGAVLAALDVNETLAGLWLPGGDDCADATAEVGLPDTSTTAKVGPTGLLLDQQLAGGTARSICVPLGDAIAGARDGAGAVVAFAPEAVDVCVSTPAGLEAIERPPVVTPTLWRLQVVTPDDLPAQATALVAVGRDGQVLQEVELSSLP
jgi:hypothetical protein